MTDQKTPQQPKVEDLTPEELDAVQGGYSDIKWEISKDAGKIRSTRGGTSWKVEEGVGRIVTGGKTI